MVTGTNWEPEEEEQETVHTDTIHLFILSSENYLLGLHCFGKTLTGKWYWKQTSMMDYFR